MTIPIEWESIGVFRRYLRPQGRGAGWLVTAAVLAGTAFLGSGALLIRKRPAASETWATPSQSLRVERLGSQLLLTWNRKSPVIRRADTGRLLIEDGDARREIPLDATHLRLGSITYAPVSSQVRFRVDFSAPGRNDFSESVIVRLAARAPQPPAQVAQQAARAPQPPAQVAQQPAPVVRAPVPAKAKPLAPVPRHKPKPSAPDPQPSQPSQSAAPADYEPPRPVKKVAPVLPSALRPVILRPVTVEVAVGVDAAGNVVGARPAGPYRVSESVIEAAVQAARQWKFQPARRGDRKMPSAIVLRFKFKPGG